MANIRLLQGWGTWRHIIEIGLDAKMLSTSPPVGDLAREILSISSEHFATHFQALNRLRLQFLIDL